MFFKYVFVSIFSVAISGCVSHSQVGDACPDVDGFVVTEIKGAGQLGVEEIVCEKKKPVNIENPAGRG